MLESDRRNTICRLGVWKWNGALKGQAVELTIEWHFSGRQAFLPSGGKRGGREGWQPLSSVLFATSPAFSGYCDLWLLSLERWMALARFSPPSCYVLCTQDTHLHYPHLCMCTEVEFTSAPSGIKIRCSSERVKNPSSPILRHAHKIPTTDKHFPCHSLVLLPPSPRGVHTIYQDSEVVNQIFLCNVILQTKKQCNTNISCESF